MGADSERGLTLVEVLVVLAILGVAAGLTTLSLGGRAAGGAAREEAVRLAARLRLAADDARLDERPLAFAWDERGYAFLDWDAAANRWVPDRLGALARHDLPGGLALAVEGLKPPVPIGAEGLGPAITARIRARGSAWDVRFDGLDARATAATTGGAGGTE